MPIPTLRANLASRIAVTRKRSSTITRPDLSACGQIRPFARTTQKSDGLATFCVVDLVLPELTTAGICDNIYIIVKVSLEYCQ